MTHQQSNRHHRSLHAYEEHWRRKHRANLRRRAFAIVGVALMMLALAFIVLTLVSPQLLMRLSGSQGGNRMATNAQSPHASGRYDGLDISHHQGHVEWGRVGRNPNVQFVYLKATEGSGFVDRCYARNVAGARRAGIAVGSYHYLTSGSSMLAQFRNFYSVVDRRKQDVVPMVDIEREGIRGWSRRQMQDSLAAFIHLIETHYLCTPMIYAHAKFYNDNLAPRFNHYRLFLARYNMQQPVVAGDGRHDLWQHTDQGVVEGIGSLVDLDVFSAGTTLADIHMPPYKPLPK